VIVAEGFKDMPPMKSIVRIVTIALVALGAYCTPSDALACKDRLYPAHFPIDELSEYDNVFVFHVAEITLSKPLSESWYMPPFSFEGKIIKVLKGRRIAGSTIQGTTSSGEEATARCPVKLRSGGDYLVMLNGDANPYILPRYGSLYIPSDDEHFNGYVADIGRFYANKRQKHSEQ
jgi:hypothetical protein